MFAGSSSQMRHENYPMSLWIALATKIKAQLRGISDGSTASVVAAEHFVRFCPFRRTDVFQFFLLSSLF